MYSLVFIGVAAFILCLLITPVVRNLSKRYGAVDHPDGKRKIHQHAIPRVGGIAIAVAYVGAFGLLLAVPLQGGNLVVPSLPLMWKLLPAALAVFSTGLLDDLMGLRPSQKLAGEIVAGVLAFCGGIQVHAFAGIHFPYWLSLPLTVGWLILCTNAFNLIDGVDGLAAGVGLFATCTMLVAAFTQHNVPLALATMPLAGALLGFLRYNFNPATIFLGDSGSLFVGFLLGCFGVVWSQKSATILGMTAPLMALAIPLLDTGLAVVRRFLRQKPIFGADRGHIHHRLLDRGFTPRKVALVLYGCCGLGALCSLGTAQGSFSGPVILIFCAITWIGVEHLGYVEFGVAGRMFMDGAFRRLLNSHIALQSFEQQLTGAHTPHDCWKIIQLSAADFGFHDIRMHLAGHAFQHRNGLAPSRAWNIRIPITESDYIELTREFQCSTQPAAVASFADVVRTTLLPKVAAFAVAPPSPLQSRAAAQGD